jgi:alkylation response protein AidB-like acyl-CoA dehydrogenase
MDFSFSDEQEAVRDLARQIFADRVSHERLTGLERDGVWFDDELWNELAKANLTALSLPEAVGGSGCGILEVCLVLEELGRHVAPVPLFPTLLLGGAPLAEFGAETQCERWLAPVAERAGVVTAALEEVGCENPTRPRTRAVPDGSGWRLTGEKVCVPAAQRAGCILVPARTGDGAVGVFLVEPDAAGVALEQQVTTNREPHARLRLDGAAVAAEAVLAAPGEGARVIDWTVEHALVGLCAIQLGLAEEALRRTAEYIGQRKQFDRPIATFQGVTMRAADAFIDIECMRSTLYQAAWRLSARLPAGPEVAAAKWWACRGGQRVVHTAQHLHGGIGSDVDYPIHRFFLWSKQLDLTLGGASHQLARLGTMLVGDEAQPR